MVSFSKAVHTVEDVLGHIQFYNCSFIIILSISIHKLQDHFKVCVSIKMGTNILMERFALERKGAKFLGESISN